LVGQSSAQIPFIPRGVCFQCGQTGHNVRECPFNDVATTPKPKQAFHRGKSPPKTSKVKPPAYDYGYVNHVSIQDSHKSTDVVLGTLPVNSTPASVLFDPGASHSFISQDFALSHDISFSMLSTPLVVQAPRSRWHTTMVSHENEVAIEGLVFLASLIALKSSDIDVILGMDWLSRQNGVLD